MRRIGTPKCELNLGVPPLPGELRTVVENLATEAIKESPKSRIQLSDQISAISGELITVHMLNDFTARGKTRMPLYLVPAFCEATGSDSLQRFCIGPRITQALELGELVELVLDEKARARIRALGSQIKLLLRDTAAVRRRWNG